MEILKYFFYYCILRLILAFPVAFPELSFVPLDDSSGGDMASLVFSALDSEVLAISVEKCSEMSCQFALPIVKSSTVKETCI